VKSISEAFFIKLFAFTGKSSANNSKQYRKLIQEDSERSCNQYILFKVQLLPATNQDSGEFTFQQDCRSAQNTLFYDIDISHGSVATRFRWDGIFNDCCIANKISWRMWQWKKFENRPVFDEVMCRLRRLTFLAHPVFGNAPKLKKLSVVRGSR